MGPKRAYIPAECCTIVEGQIFKARLNGEQTSAMLAVACRSPKPNAELITTEGMDVLGHKSTSQNTTFTNFGLKVSEHMETIYSRVLQPPVVRYKSGAVVIAPNSAGWNLRGVKFPLGGVLRNWVIMAIKDNGRFDFGSPDTVKPIQDAFIQMCKVSGMQVIDERPRVIPCNLPPKGPDDFMRDSAARAITDTLNKLCATQKPNFLLVFLSSEDKNVYNHIKTQVDCRFGIPTVCCLSEKIQKPAGQMQYLGNIALKANLKTGGRNHELGGDALSILGTDSMILGADVTHPTAKESVKYTPSIAAVVGSWENTYSLYPGGLRLQKSRQEVSPLPLPLLPLS